MDVVWARSRPYMMARDSRNYFLNLTIGILLTHTLEVVPITWHEILDILDAKSINWNTLLYLTKIIVMIHTPHKNAFYIDVCARIWELVTNVIYNQPFWGSH